MLTDDASSDPYKQIAALREVDETIELQKRWSPQ
jgi:hypothetical protein